MVTERLRTLIRHISNYFQALENLEKTLSDKNEPNSTLLIVFYVFILRNSVSRGQSTPIDHFIHVAFIAQNCAFGVRTRSTRC